MLQRQFLLTATSPAAASTVVTTQTAEKLEQFDWFTVDAKLQGATGGTLSVYLQRFCSVLNEWLDWLSFTQQAAAGALVRYSIDCRASAVAITTVGQGSSPALTAGVMACSHPGTKVRLVFVAGASTSAGAAQSVVLTGWKQS